MFCSSDLQQFFSWPVAFHLIQSVPTNTDVIQNGGRSQMTLLKSDSPRGEEVMVNAWDHAMEDNCWRLVSLTFTNYLFQHKPSSFLNPAKFVFVYTTDIYKSGRNPLPHCTKLKPKYRRSLMSLMSSDRAVDAEYIPTEQLSVMTVHSLFIASNN